jgi:Zn-finger nucleic acid-binding protein
MAMTSTVGSGRNESREGKLSVMLAMVCPKCFVHMERLECHGTVVDGCHYCGVLVLTTSELDRITGISTQTPSHEAATNVVEYEAKHGPTVPFLAEYAPHGTPQMATVRTARRWSFEDYLDFN